MKKWYFILIFLFVNSAFGQTFYRGNDLSYANQMEDCGANFKEKGVLKDVYKIFADHGCNLVRVRLWYNPMWQNSLVQPAGVKSQYSDFEDVKKTIKRAKDAGMQVMLDIHLSDIWADPANQLIPSQWLNVATNTAALGDSVYNYVHRVLTKLNSESLMPEIVKIGNENNGGILRHTTLNADYTVTGSVSTDWTRHAELYNKAIKAVRDISATTTIKPKIALHEAGLSTLNNWYQNIISKGVTDFDIIGFSYYYAWHSGSIATLGNTIRALKSSFPKYDVMVVETGYLWSNQNYDAMSNIISTPDPAYLPISPEKQLEYMVDYTREVKRAGGNGVIFWEPEWVSTPCRTPWGQGSSHDHVAFFDPSNHNFMENGGGNWMMPEFYQDLTTKKVTFKVDMTGQNVAKGVFITGKMTGNPQKIIRMASEGQGIYSYVTYLSSGDFGEYHFMNDSALSVRETVPATCALVNGTDRKYIVDQVDVVFGNTWATCEPLGKSLKVNVTFKVDMTGQDVANGVWITGAWTGASWKIMPMINLGSGIYSYQTTMNPSDKGAYYFMNKNEWGKRESVPAACAAYWNSDRGYSISAKDTVYYFKWGACESLLAGITQENLKIDCCVYPNPTSGLLKIEFNSSAKETIVEIYDQQGKKLEEKHFIKNSTSGTLNFADKAKGIYFLKILLDKKTITKKVVVN